MLRDTSTVLWKEVAELAQGIKKPAAWIGMTFYLVMFGVFPVFLIGPLFATSPMAFAYWIILPIMVGTGVSLNAFAGERERHTLETLLATRLPDRAILFGKLAAGVIYSSFYLVLAMLAGLVTLNLMHGQDTLVAYTPAVTVGGLLIGVFVSAVMSVAGVLASLRSASVREAGQKLSFIMLLFFFLYFGMSFVPIDKRAELIQAVNTVNTWLVIGVASVVLSGVFGVLLTQAMRQFQRQHLLLNDQQPATSNTQAAKTPQGKQVQPSAKAAAPAKPQMHLPIPLAHLLTVMGKEWRELHHRDSHNAGRRMLIVGLVLFGILLPLQGGREWVTEGGALFAWIIAPTIIVMQTIADSFAGERERHTLETLLATPLSDRVILFGKLLTPLLWAWGVTQGLILASTITTNIAFWQGSVLFFSPAMLLAGMGFGLLVSGLLATTGVLLSLRAASVRQAQQSLSIAWIVLAILYVVLIVVVIITANYLGMDLAGWIESGAVAPLAWGAAAVLLLLDGVMLTLAMHRFQRARLLLA
jgi:ABC-2 type transport system permease protein